MSSYPKNPIYSGSTGNSGNLATGKKESAIQSECFQYHWNQYPQERGRLFMVYNNGKNAAHGNILKAMGMVKGVSDMILLRPSAVLFLECKRPGEKQSPEQVRFQQLVTSLGFQYFVFRSLDEFKEILTTGGAANGNTQPLTESTTIHQQP